MSTLKKKFISRKQRRFGAVLGLSMVSISGAVAPAALHAQATLAAGTIQGTITDATGAAVSGAKITLTEPSTGFLKQLVSSGSGYYTTGSLSPGNYKLHVEAPGFSTTDETITVQVGNSANGNLKLGVGSATQEVQVQGSAVEVDTQQTAIQGVLDQQEIQNLPLNGRNFLDLAQLQPGVQIQDGGNFDPTKAGFSSISFGGRAGRTARIEVDGLDISDENVGTTTQNVSEDSIQEFQVAQSNLDITTSITSSGSVNIVSRSGTNAVHGDEFYNFRDKRAGGANFPGGQNDYLQRNNVGGAVGGAIIPDKAFYFFSAEHMQQHLAAPVVLTDSLAAQSGSFSSPFKELELQGRFDFNLQHGVRAFVRGLYNRNTDVSTFGGSNNYSPYLNTDNTPNVGGGLDFLTGSFSHSIRLGYFKFVNHITDATRGGGVYNPAPSVEISIGPFLSGPNFLAPQTTVQSNRQFRYDGSWTKGVHTVRYGVAYTRIGGGGLASFYGIAPEVFSSDDTATVAAAAASTAFPGGSSNPLNYPLGMDAPNGYGVLIGNGQGYSTTLPKFGLPAGGLNDSRLAAYLGDNWKLSSRLNVNYGIRYIHDTGRSDSKLPAIPLLNGIPGLDPILGNKIHQPGSNFGPQAGVSYDPFGKGKTVIRAGGGLYYENNVWNNIYFDQPARLQQGLFFGATVACPSPSLALPGGGSLSSIDGQTIASLCGQPIGSVAKQLGDLETAYQAAVAAAGAAANGNYVGNTLTESSVGTGDQLFYPSYKTPISYQMNIGVQQEISKNFVVTADYLRNVNVHTLLAIDENHVGDARYLNVANAQGAVTKTLAACGVTSVDEAIISCPGIHGVGGGATIADFAGNGLGSEYLDGGSGFPGSGYAFDGINPTFGTLQYLKPIGRSTYDALQVSAHEHASHPLPYVSNSDLTVAYSLSRFDGNQKDQDFGGTAIDYNNPTKFFGPSGLDRLHQFSVGLDFQTYRSLHISTIAHINSSLPETLSLQNLGTGSIFTSDVTGDGTAGDVLPGTNVGSYMRSVKPGDINKVIANYNTKYAGTLSPAGAAIVKAGVLSQAQMSALGGVLESVTPAPTGATVGNDILRVFDLAASYPFKLGETLTVEPSVHAFNILNAANFDNAGTSGSSNVNGVLNGSPGSANNNTYTSNEQYRVGLGTGVYSFGAPRQLEFGLKMTF